MATLEMGMRLQASPEQQVELLHHGGHGLNVVSVCLLVDLVDQVHDLSGDVGHPGAVQPLVQEGGKLVAHALGLGWGLGPGRTTAAAGRRGGGGTGGAGPV